MTQILDTLGSMFHFFGNIYTIIQHMFQGIGYALQYVQRVVQMEWAIIPTLPQWLTGFVILSATMTMVMIIAGRYRGK